MKESTCRKLSIKSIVNRVNGCSKMARTNRRTVYFSGFSTSSDVNDIKRIFNVFGTISTISMPPGFSGSKSLGAGYVEFAHHSSSSKAIMCLNGKRHNKSTIKVKPYWQSPYNITWKTFCARCINYGEKVGDEFLARHLESVIIIRYFSPFAKRFLTMTRLKFYTQEAQFNYALDENLADSPEAEKVKKLMSLQDKQYYDFFHSDLYSDYANLIVDKQ